MMFKREFRLAKAFKTFGEMAFLFLEIIRCSFTRPFYTKRLMEQIHAVGIQSISITIVIGLTMGMVMSLNFGHGLKKFGGTLYVPAVVALSIVRQLSPIFTSLLVAGRVGSGMAAEIGSMNVTQQVDALRALGTSPVRVLVVPRFWATIISLPLLTTLSSILGILGGMIICEIEFGIPSDFFLNKALVTIKLPDFLSSLVKTACFGVIISLIATYKGLYTRGGTRGVGSSTTWSVVYASIGILLFDFFFNKTYIYFFTP